MQPLNILCVDDEPLVLESLALVLRRYGFQVATAASASQALSAAASERIDVALVDRSVCQRAGLCLSDALRECQPDMVVILHTGNPDAAECLGKVPLLVKPVDPVKIAAKIEEIVRGGWGDAAPREDAEKGQS